MERIPLPRLRIYLLLLGLLPLLLSGLITYNRMHAVKRAEGELWDLGHKIALKEERLAPNRKVREAHIGADHFWVDKELETYLPLKPEIAALKKLESWGLPSREGQKRLALLEGKENCLLFTEGVHHKDSTMEEVIESSAHQIQVDAADLKTLLSYLEGSSDTPRPQTLVTDFRLQRKGLQGGDEVFNLDLKFVKREFLP